MSILDIKTKGRKKQMLKTSVTFLVLSLVAVGVNYIYGMFGHGVHSAAMTWMFLYPLLGGALIYLIGWWRVSSIIHFPVYRFAYNSYNSGIATLTIGSFLKGVLEIAGTNSPYLAIFSGAGGLFIAIGMTIFIILAVKRQKIHATIKETNEFRYNN